MAQVRVTDNGLEEVLFPGESRYGYWKHVYRHPIFFCCEACGTGTDELEISSHRVTTIAEREVGHLCFSRKTRSYATVYVKNITSYFIGTQNRSCFEILTFPCYLCCCNPAMFSVGDPSGVSFTVEVDQEHLKDVRIQMSHAAAGFMPNAAVPGSNAQMQR